MEGLEDLEYLYAKQWDTSIGSASTVINLKDTSLKNAFVSGIIANIYYPSCITNIYCLWSLPIISENSNDLTSIRFTGNQNEEMSLKDQFFYNLKNAQNLKELHLRRLESLRISSLSTNLIYELPSVTTLDLSGFEVSNPASMLKDLKGIELFTGLETLTMNYTNQILDISAIKNCPTLEEVTLGYCNIQSLNGIEGLTNLKTLNINNNNITALKPLENLKNLTSLNLENNAIADTSSYVENGETKTYRNLDILAGLHTSKGGKLTTLYLVGNDNIIDYSPVSSLNWSNKSGF